jgi:hypothetical protein
VAGVRIQHPAARSCRFTIVEGDRPYPVPYQCTPPEFGGCGSTHLFKTHHLNVDAQGSVIVGDVLYQRIRRLLELNGFTEANVVERPPALGLGLATPVEGRGAWGNIPIIEGVLNRG